MCIHVSFYPRKTPLFDRELILPVGTECILTNQAKSNYPAHTNGAERFGTELALVNCFVLLDDGLQSASVLVGLNDT